MIRWLFILILAPLCWGEEAPVQVQESELAPAQEQNLLIIVDLQGALFYPKASSTKVASIQNPQVAEAIINYQQKHGAKILYLAEHSSEAMFWQNSIKASHLPLEERFSLDSQTFGGFEGSIPSCRGGIVLCQGQPLGEILGLVLNGLSVWTQFYPQKILFYTVNKDRGEIVSAIGSRIGALVEVNLVKGTVGKPAPEVKEPPQAKIATLIKITPQLKKQKVITEIAPPKEPTKTEKKSGKVQVTTATAVSEIAKSKFLKPEPSKPEVPKLELPKDGSFEDTPKKADLIEPTTEPKKELPQKVDATTDKPIESNKKLPPIEIDESKLEYV